jgi:hypothetical protein
MEELRPFEMLVKIYQTRYGAIFRKTILNGVEYSRILH